VTSKKWIPLSGSKDGWPALLCEDESMAVLTDKQAYEAMFYFLGQRYERLQEDALAPLLGDMSTLEDGCVVDPAVEKYWKSAVDFALSDGVASRMVLKKSQ
jgi:hypothetical protein